MVHKNANKKLVQKENAKTKEIINPQKMQMQKHNTKHIKIKKIYCKFKNANCRKCFWAPAWFTFRGRAGYAVSVAWFSCIQVPGFASHSVCARMSFSSVWVCVPASTLDWAHRFSRKGWWLAQPPSPSPKRCFSGKRVPTSQRMALPRVHLFCFFCIRFLSIVFVVVVVVVVAFLCFLIVFLVFFFTPLFAIFSKNIQFWRSPIRIGDLPFRLVACPLGRREPQHWAFFFGFTGSPRTSLFKFNVSVVICVGFTTLSMLICCFHVCCIWHFPFSLVAFHLSKFSTYHVVSFQLALVPSMYFSFVKGAPFQVAFVFYFSSICNFCLFSICILFSHFFSIVMCASFRFACSNSMFLHCIVSPFFSRCKHPRTNAIRQHKTKCKHFNVHIGSTLCTQNSKEGFEFNFVDSVP